MVTASPIEILVPREVPLGGLRAMSVRRTLPGRERSLIGAWCFVDHYGPTRVGGNVPGMDVAPHPHTGLQTVSWLFAGEIEHRDSGGVRGMVRPGEMNLMTAGAGICHSEVSTAATEWLHGVQLWVALPEEARHTQRGFQHHVPDPVEVDGGFARVFLGDLLGIDRSPVVVHTPIVGAQLDLDPGARLDLAVDPSLEHGVLLDQGILTIDGVPCAADELAYRPAGPSALTLEAGPNGARLVLLGGQPFEEEIVMWWNFVGRSHEEIVAFREEWEAESERFGQVEGYVGARPRIPAPALPGVRLRTRSSSRR